MEKFNQVFSIVLCQLCLFVLINKNLTSSTLNIVAFLLVNILVTARIILNLLNWNDTTNRKWLLLLGCWVFSIGFLVTTTMLVTNKFPF